MCIRDRYNSFGPISKAAEVVALKAVKIHVFDYPTVVWRPPHPHSGENFGVFPLEQTRHVGVAKSERPRLTKGEIIFEEFQPMWSQFTNVTDRRTDGQTDDMRSQYRALH